MDFAIELEGGRDGSRDIDLSFEMTDGWPEYVYVSRYARDTICVSPSLAQWEPEMITKAFAIYRRTDRTNKTGRRIYEREG